MDHGTVFKIGTFFCRIEQDFSSDFFNLWSNRVEPYLVESIESENMITISYRKKIFPEKRTFLKSESSGFFASYITKDCNDTIYFQYIRKSNQKAYVTFSAERDYREICLLEDNTNSYRVFPFEYLGQIIPFSALTFKILTLHAVLMEYDGKGIVLSAPSGTGKSTHAHFWRDCYRALIINGDRALCGKENSIWTGYGMPWCGSSGEYINRDVPIRAIVVLQQAEENEARLLTPLEGFQRMYENLVLPQWDKDKVNQGLDLFDDMLANIPVYLLKCRPEAEAAAVLKREIDKL